MVLEASRVLQEGVAGDPGEIDLGVLFGLGFPAARGGLLWWADTLGADQIVQRLQPMSPIGPRMLPSTLLADMAERGLRFYGDVGEAGARPLESRL